MAAVSKIEKGVVELRTDVGRLYVCPTPWQRLYLRWTFRNFHSLPQQILNRRQKRLIENLSRSAILTPAERVPASAIIGIVENMTVLALPSTAEMAEAAKAPPPAVADTKLAVLQGRADEVAMEARAAEAVESAPARVAAAPKISASSANDVPGGVLEESVVSAPKVEHESAQGTRRIPWALALGSAGVAAVLLLAFWLASLLTLPQLNLRPAHVPPAPPLQTTEHRPHAAIAVTKPLSSVEGSAAAQHAGKRTATAAAPQTAVVPEAVALPQIVEAPRSGFIYPVAPNPNLVGKVVLKAVVGSDGAVKQVEILSGDRELASAAVRAVRQWRYAPAEVDGHTVDAETHVTISFLGDDAVSIILPPAR